MPKEKKKKEIPPVIHFPPKETLGTPEETPVIVSQEQTYTESQVKEAIKMLYNFNDDVLIEKLWSRLKERLNGIALK